LTEVLSELISRAPHSIQTELICEAFLPQFLRSNFREITRGQTINARSQMSIEQGRSIDLVIFSGGKPVIAVESKVGAAFQYHRRRLVPSTELNETDAQYDHQLATYGQWLAGSATKPDSWPGVITLLTHRSLAPPNFAPGGEPTFGSVPHQSSWRSLAGRIGSLIRRYDESDAGWRFVAIELCKFLEDKNMAATDLSSTDISALNLSMERLRDTASMFAEVSSELVHRLPTELNGRRKGSDNDAVSSRVWGWTFFQGTTEVYLGYGLYFPPLFDHFRELDGKVGPHEQAFIAVGSDARAITASLDRVPSNWFGVAENWLFVRPVPLSQRLEGERFPEFLVRSVHQYIDDIRTLVTLFREPGPASA
jgi:hypothetical protein